MELNTNADSIRLIEGNLFVDDRGQLSFVNEFNFAGIKRFYIVENHVEGFVRAWHAHKIESKYVLVIDGAALVGAVKIDNWEKPSKMLDVKKYVLSSKKPVILYIPKGYANGFMSLSKETKIMYLSTTTLEESKGDDYRYDARYWDVWTIVER